jgi:hypothetical protein
MGSPFLEALNRGNGAPIEGDESERAKLNRGNGQGRRLGERDSWWLLDEERNTQGEQRSHKRCGCGRLNGTDDGIGLGFTKRLMNVV